MAYTTIDNPELYFQTKIHTGTGSELAVTLDGSENMQPDFVWFKNRTQDYSHRLFDSVRGATKLLYSDLTESEGTDAQGLKSFDSDGFTIGTDGGINTNTNSIVSWNWKESATAGFDIVSYTGNNSNRTISHSLSAVPKMMIIKRRTGTATAWLVYHASVGATKGLNLNTTATPDTASTYFQDTAPSSSVFTLGATGEVNADSATYINYLFADVQGYSKFGSYIGNGNADGPFIHLGFKPAFLMYKRTDTAKSWYMNDNKRDVHNPVDGVLLADATDAENASHGNKIDFLANGFKSRSTGSTVNTDGGTYLYMAFAENPFVTSTGVPATAR